MVLSSQAEAKARESAQEPGRVERSRVTQDLMIVNTRARVRRFMLEELQENGFQESVADDDSLLEKQILDSLSILKLISFVDEEFGIFFREDELEPERFESVNRITELILRKIGEKSAGQR